VLLLTYILSAPIQCQYIFLSLAKQFYNSFMRCNWLTTQFTYLEGTIQRFLYVHRVVKLSPHSASKHFINTCSETNNHVPIGHHFSQAPSFKQPLTYFLTLWICLFWTCYIDGITHNVVFCNCFPQLSMMFLKFIHFPF
jgi:hypothetical protein